MNSITYLAKNSSMSELIKRAEKMSSVICLPGHGLVWGEGPLSAKLVMIGEAPGDKEEKLARPFVGSAGRLLDIELELAGIHRESTWLTNVVKCRPVKQTNGGTINRTPTAKEVEDWLGPLMEELEIIEPRLIVCLGAVAANLLIHRNFTLTSERGQWFDGPLKTRIMATFHPAYVLRQGGSSWNETLEAFRKDLKQTAEELEKLEKEPKPHM